MILAFFPFFSHLNFSFLSLLSSLSLGPPLYHSGIYLSIYLYLCLFIFSSLLILFISFFFLWWTFSSLSDIYCITSRGHRSIWPLLFCTSYDEQSYPLQGFSGRSSLQHVGEWDWWFFFKVIRRLAHKLQLCCPSITCSHYHSFSFWAIAWLQNLKIW